jgi:hypothetical protein
VTGGSGTTTIVNSGARSTPLSQKEIQNAVYGHLRAIRALGRTEVLPSEIAAALAISPSLVLEALSSLQNKGVKLHK